MGRAISGSSLDVRDIAEEEKICYPNRVYVKANVDEKIHIYDGRPHCVLTMTAPVYAAPLSEQASIMSSLLMAHQMWTTGNPPSPGSDQPLDPAEAANNEQNSFPNATGTALQQMSLGQLLPDASSINIMGYMPGIVMPAVAAIPMRSNIRSYGPYASSNFRSSDGGVTVEVNTDICPWVFGGIAGMNAAAMALVESNQVEIVKAETGSYTLPGYPNMYRVGDLLQGNGPVLTDLNFSYGSNGVTTTYRYQTYTPKRGGLALHAIDQIKVVSKYRTEQLRFLKNEAAQRQKLGRKVGGIRSGDGKLFIHQSINKGPRSSNSLDRVLVGVNFKLDTLQNDTRSIKTIAGNCSFSKSTAETAQGYQHKAITSMEFFFGPVSRSGDAGLPRFAIYEIPEEYETSGVATSGNSVCAHPPVSDYYVEDNIHLDELVLNQYNLDISRNFLDPLVFPNMKHHHKDDKSTVGHMIELVGRGQHLPKRGLMGSLYKMDDNLRYSSYIDSFGEVEAGKEETEPDYRFMAFRGPMVLQQWGYDTDGKPIPNASDVEQDASVGKFTRESLKDEFLTDWVAKPTTWPVGPIDLRFDRNRGVWTAPPPYRIIAAELLQDLEAGKSAAAKVLKDFDQDLYDKDGKPIEDPTIRIKDRIDAALPKGTKVYCYYDTYLAEYIAFSTADAFPTIVTAKATAKFTPNDKTASVAAVSNATLDGKHIDPEFLAYFSSKINKDNTGPTSVIELLLKAYNVKRCGAEAGDLVTLHKVSTGGFDTETSLGYNTPYVYIVVHTGDNNEDSGGTSSP